MTRIMDVMIRVKVRKILPDGSVKVEYSGTVREMTDEYLSIDTGWSREQLDLGYVVFDPGDGWIETFYLDRWYNIFRIADEEGELKGFYINITKPPVVDLPLITWEDLAIDIWVYPSGKYIILDMDEFEELDIDERTREGALRALKEAEDLVLKKEGALSELRS